MKTLGTQTVIVMRSWINLCMVSGYYARYSRKGI